MTPLSGSPESRPSAAAAPTERYAGWTNARLFGLLLLATLLAYGPALRGDFLWDDDGHVTRPDLQSVDGLLRIWTEPGTTQQYYPLLHTAFWIEHQVWGDSPLGYHLVNVLWHALAATLLAAFLRRLAVPGAWLAAGLFALHPVAVESVAWISEQKNTLSAVCYLLAALAWLRFEETRRPGAYAVATLWFLAALLTKTVTATLPAALLVITWWRRGHLRWREDVRPLLPWFALGAAAASVTVWFESTHIGASGSEFALGPSERVLLAGRVGWFYLSKLLWPTNLTFFYPRWTLDPADPVQWLWVLATVATLAGAYGWSRRQSRAPLAAVLLYGGTLFPVLGFVNVYPFVFSYVADHFQYLASTAVFALLGAALVKGARRLGWSGGAARASAGVVLVTLGFLTWRQSAMYRDGFSLYQTTLERNPDSWVAHLNLGAALDDSGRPAEALPHLLRADALKPDFPETLNSLGSVLNQLGRSAEARPRLERAVQLQPRFAAAHNTLGVALMNLQDAPSGIAAFERAVALAPGLTTARLNLAWALANGGRLEAAVVQFEAARQQTPEDPELETKWGLAYIIHQRPTEALPHFRRAAALDPENPDARVQVGRLLLQLGRASEATTEFEAALMIDPSNPGAQEGLMILQGARRR